jgi:Tfp pilus assembly major pilin PilA
MYIYTDVLAFDSPETILAPTADSMLVLAARVLTADAPVTLKVHPAPNTGCVIRVYASILDQPVTVQSYDASQSVSLKLGPQTNNVGAVITITAPTSSISIKYYQQYFHSQDEVFEATLATQLRIAQALFWQKPSIALSLCAHGATATARPALYPALNAQAVALGQQLAAQAMTGPDTTYAPALTISQYRKTVEDAINVLETFQTQYERFQDQEAGLEDQKAAWQRMLEQSSNQQALRAQTRDFASSKYTDACATRDSCCDLVTASRHELESARQAFQDGLLAWEEQAVFEGVFGLLGGIIAFDAKLYSISTASSLDGVLSAISAIKEIVNQVKAAEQNTAKQDRKISWNTLQQLSDSMGPLERLYFSMVTLVTAVKECETDPNAVIPPVDDVSGTSQGDADARLIVTLAAWDTWTLESVSQLDFAIAHSIRGTASYRTALQKYSINGKALAQADAQATKAGQEYVLAEMEVITCQKDIRELEDLIGKYTGEAALYAAAKAKFYDSFLSMQTSVGIQMRNMAWAYKYWALEDSPLVLDSQKTTAQFRYDVYAIDEAMNEVNSRNDRILQCKSLHLANNVYH